MKNPYFSLIVKGAIAFAILLFMGIMGVMLIVNILNKGLPPLTKLETYQPSLITRIYSADNKLIKEFYIERRDLVPLERIPQHLLDALIATEDRRFMQHWGVDLKRIIQVIYIDVKKRALVQGASTITQQLSRSLYLTRKKSFLRKIKEALTAVKIEKTYSKSEILQMYLNQSYFGHGAYGIQSAALFYFMKNVEDLTVEESATLIALLKAPAHYSPITRPAKSLTRRNVILTLMQKNNALSPHVADSIKSIPLKIDISANAVGIAPYFVEHVRRKLEKEYGTSVLYNNGVSVYTTLDTKLQEFAEKAVKKQLLILQNLVDEKTKVKYATYESIDSLAQKKVQIGFVALDPETGHIKAMIGGRNFLLSKFNRVTQALRQVGSAFKPFVYTAAIDNGYTPLYTILDNPIVIPMLDGSDWRPKNYDRKFRGPTTIRDGLTKSINLISIKLIQQIKPHQVIKYARKMGVKTNILPVLSIAVGSCEIKLLELVSAYAVYANKGIKARPLTITEIRNQDGSLLKKYNPYSEEALREETAYIMAHMLQDVIRRGTGHNAVKKGFDRPAGGKTGTTNEYTDAWFIGFTPQLAAGVWIGFDDNTSLEKGLTGSRAALPIWADFMIAAHDSTGLPIQEFRQPDGVVEKKVCKDSKDLLSEYCPNPIDEVFIKGTEPIRSCEIHIPTGTEKTIQKYNVQRDSIEQLKIKRRGLQF